MKHSHLSFLPYLLLVIVFGSIMYIITVSEDVIEYTQTEYEMGKIIDSREATFVDMKTKRHVDGCNIIYSDAQGIINDEDVRSINGEACKELKNIKEIEIKVNIINKFSKRKQEIIDTKIKKSLVIEKE